MFGEGVFDVARCKQRFDVGDIGMFSMRDGTIPHRVDCLGRYRCGIAVVLNMIHDNRGSRDSKAS